MFNRLRYLLLKTNYIINYENTKIKKTNENV